MAIELTEEQKKQGYKVVKLGDICSTVASGGTPSRKVAEYYSDELGIPWVKTQEIRNNRISSTGEFISQLGLENSSAKIFPQGTILIAMYGATVGRIGWLTRPMATNQAACALVVDTEKATAKYIYYALFQRRSDLINLAIGAAQQNLNLTTIKNFEIALPPLSKQKRIANILGSLDDKIDANNSLIETMQNLIDAQVQSQSAEDYKFVKLDSLAQLSKVQSLPSKVTTNPVLHYSLPAFDAGGVPSLEDSNSILSNKFLIEKPCVLFSKLNPGTPRIWMVDPSSEYLNFASTEFVVLEPKESVDVGSLWAMCRDPRITQELKDYARGTSSSHQRVSPADILDVEVINARIPEEESQIIHRKISENIFLSNLRNSLIKKIIK